MVKDGKRLRVGYTTGSCAAAASKAAAQMLLSGELVSEVGITLPSGKALLLAVSDVSRTADSVSCAVTKDGGDDPDVTSGMKIFSTVVKEKLGFFVEGGVGIGRVTKPGLACKVGEAAINPVPRKMILNALEEVSAAYGYSGGLTATISAPEGEEIAKKTFNGRLGIVGGISILGTTGVVEPMSEKALLDTIKLEISTRDREKILFLAPGNYGLTFAREQLKLDIDRAVKCSNFIGEALDYAVYCGFRRILLVGHMGKLLKLAAGVMNTHSKTADGRAEIMVCHSALCGGGLDTLQALMGALTTEEMHGILKTVGIEQAVYQSIREKIQFHLNYRVKEQVQVAFVVFTNESGVLMESLSAQAFIEEVRAEE